MKAVTFRRGGIHPPDNKAHSSHRPIEEIWPKAGAEMVYPMVQHLGAPCEPVVQVGDHVSAGQKIGESKAFVAAPIHASVSGEVKAIRQVLTPGGTMCNAVVIEFDGETKEYKSASPIKNYKEMTNEEIVSAIKEAGIVGLGGAGFPTHIKLSPPADKKIDTLIVNGAECEPYLTTDHRVMLEETQRIIRGLEIMLHLFPGAKGIIGVEANKPDAIGKLQDAVKDIDNIQIVELTPKYPQGAEKQLINACTGREVPSGGLPADIGCIVDNVDTVLAIERAMILGKPLMRRIVTVTGKAVKNPGNYKIRLGMSYQDLIDATGGFTQQPAKLISGGPMMGIALYSLDVPLIKTSSSVICMSADEAYMPPERNCIRCGKCVEICPMGLMPLVLNQNVLFHEIDEFKKNNGMDCIECGSCSYICPAKRHLAQSFRFTKKRILSQKKK